MKTKRLTVIDILRAVSVISMVVYHTMWDLVYIHGVSIPWFMGEGAAVFQAYIRWSFILLSGFSWSLGKHRLRRALTVIAASAVISTVTYFMMPESMIRYGVLSLLGCAMLVMIPLDKLFKRMQPVLGLAVSIVLFAFTYNAEVGRLGFGSFLSFELPRELFANELTAFLGFPHPGFYSSDYVPVIPWIFLFCAGYFIYGIFKKYDLLRHLSFVSCKPLEFVGRHALVIYMLHQPLIYGALYLIFKII